MLRAPILIVVLGGEGRTHELLQASMWVVPELWAARVALAALSGDPAPSVAARPLSVTPAAAG